MKDRISLDNGRTWKTASEAMSEINERNLWDSIVNMMDDEIRESVHADCAPCTNEEFLTEYLHRVDGLIIG